ncbi:MAG: peptidylprolyl isomerase [Polyangiaceae bacterium]|nr:peptidylprolyl isomerase [Polyangiaceae bacterium]
MIEDADLTSRDVTVRRAAARALARITGPNARPKLLRLLGDEDAEVVTWAAYGLGFDCNDARDVHVDALVARALALPDDDSFDNAFVAIARAVGACASPARSETTLVAWLGAKPSRARGASLGLGDFASRTKRLREESWVSLFASAAGGVSAPAVPESLYAVSRVDNVPPSVLDRLTEVASARLAEPGPYRLFAIRALGRAKAQGLAPLERVLLKGDGFTMPERVEAVRAAARLGWDGQVLIGKLIDKLAAAPALEGGEDGALLLAALAAATDAKVAPKALPALAVVPAPAGANERGRRITSLVRCAAALVPREVKADTPALVGCDLDSGWIGKTALAEVIGRSEIRGRDIEKFKALSTDADARVREAAIALLSLHPEIPDTHVILATALAAKEPGVVYAAAEQIKASPRLASAPVPAPKKKPKKKGKEGEPKEGQTPEEPPPPVAKAVEDALVSALERAEREYDLELLGAVIEAVGALGQKTLLPKIQPYCGSIYPSVRAHATNGIALLSAGRRPTCTAPDKSDAIAPEALEPLGENTKLVFDTDAGELTIELDAAVAPVAGARFVALVKRGYYDGNVIHRVDPSYVVQFGSPAADGMGGPTDLPPVRCETSPLPFEPLEVGVALAGRDTGSGQFFVMRARHPHIDGQYALIGHAKGPWDAVFEGDVIRKVTIAK